MAKLSYNCLSVCVCVCVAVGWFFVAAVLRLALNFIIFAALTAPAATAAPAAPSLVAVPVPDCLSVTCHSYHIAQ